MDIDKDRKKLTSYYKTTKQRFERFNPQHSKQQLDPFGFGDYARAFQYEEWKKLKTIGRVPFQKLT